MAAIGNAMLDLVCEVPDQFLSQEGISKGVMNLVSRERSNNILKLVKPIKETAGGSAANTISTLAKLGLDRQVVDAYIDGQTALADQRSNSIMATVGGKEQYS